VRYLLTLSYDGTAYAGWQRQKNAPSVQEMIENAIFSALHTSVRITGSGRTDAGVHALGQTCHFDGDITIPTEKLPDCLNAFLPADIRILTGETVGENFDCSRGAKRKTYAYTLYESKWELPMKQRYAVRVDSLPHLEKLQECAKLFEGEHDFKAFCASGSSVKTTVRTVYEVRVQETIENGVREVKIFVTGNGFLYNMVRTMAGELLDLASGKKTKESLQEAYQTGKRELLGKTMPAKGLTLVKVEYPSKEEYTSKEE
jgi:tRNA pseudouridine38-40 synthase